MRTIAIINQKGGVGKTTTSLNLPHALALQGKKVTLIDLDPQSHLTTGLGVHDRSIKGIDHVFLKNKSVNDVIMRDIRKDIDLIPAGSMLSMVEKEEGAKTGFRGDHLKNIFQNQFSDRDFVFMDCPPSSGILVINALYASTEALIPVASDYLALHGLSHLMGTIQNINNQLDHNIKLWIAITRFQKRRKLSSAIKEKILEYFSGKVLQTPIREGVALAESPSFGKTIFEHKKNSNGAIDYKNLAIDMLKTRTI